MLIEEQAAVARTYPLREHITAQLMVALARSGRRADALVAYESMRRALPDELHTGPPPP